MDNNAKHLCNLHDLCNFHQLIMNLIRVSLNTSSIIDHISTTCARNISNSGVHKVSMSDHYMVGLLQVRWCITKRPQNY